MPSFLPVPLQVGDLAYSLSNYLWAAASLGLKVRTHVRVGVGVGGGYLL